jgi:hypothetical protein
MALIRLQASCAADSVLARDRTVNTLHFSVPSIGFGDDDFCTSAAALFETWYGAREIVCKTYDADDAPPNFPRGEAIRNEGAAPNSGSPREVALCLSYYGARNLPRQRGRIYLGIGTASKAASGGRPPMVLREQALVFADGIANLGGVDVDWQVYSPTAGLSENVRTAYVDDEWDTMRSRGLRPTTRELRTYSE